MARDRSVILMGEDIGVYGGAFGVTRGLLDRFGADRIIDTPISESSFVGMAVGAALAGMRPVVEIMFMDFITLAVDQFVNQAAKLHYVFGEQARCPLVLRTVCGGGRAYGPTHSQSLEAWFVHAPGIKVAAPASPSDAMGLLKTAIRDDNPVLFLEHKRLYGMKMPVSKRGPHPIPFGRAAVPRKGRDLTVVAWSWMTVEAWMAAEMLAAEGIEVELIDMRTLSPLDTRTVTDSVRKTGRLLIVEEGCATAGIAAEIGFRVFEHAYDCLDTPIRRVAAPDVPVPASPVLEKAVLPDRHAIAEAAVALVEE
jgi:pyruvate dehydrogenase E1 component beta subunit